MRTWMLACLAVGFFAAGCSSSAPREERSAPARAPAAAPEAAAPQAPPPPQTAAEWEELLRRLKQSYAVTEQQKASQSDEHYRLAERYYQAGDFEKAELECEKALKLNPNHAGSNALFLEVQFILGRGKATPQSAEYDRYIKEGLVRHQQVLLEVDKAQARGTRAFNRGDYDESEREFRTILEYAKWMPTGVELETRRKQALEMLDRTKESRRQKSLDEEQQRLRLIEDEKSRENVRRLIDQKRELELLFGQAQMYFEREEYPKCVDVCERILHINPTLASVAEMRNVAQRLQFMKLDRNNLNNYVEEWKRTFEKIEQHGFVQGDVLNFPSREDWEIIAKRKPKGIAELEEDIQPEDQAIADKLRSIKITIDMQNAPLTAVVEYIREISGLNFVIDTKAIEKPEEDMISIKVADIVLDGALKLMLGPKQRAHAVRDGTVIITSADALKKRVKLELYDVQDLTYGIQDFPGVDITLSQDSIGTAVAVDEGKRVQFTGEDLANLIKNTIHKEQWEEADGKSVQFQNGLLIVRNSIDIHKSIRKFLSDLRASTGMLVNCETRFLVVEDNFLQMVGMDFRDLTNIVGLPSRVTGITNLPDINPAFVINQPFFVDPDGAGPLTATSAGISGVFGDHVTRNMGARVQNVMTNDFIVTRFFERVLRPVGGGTMQYTLLDDVSLEMILKLVSKSERNHILTAPKLTLFNTQRGNFRISNQVAYVRDYDIQIATAAVALDPIVDVVSDGISLDVRPVVSADRRFVTLELRPTVATLWPAPDRIPTITTAVMAPGAAITDAATIIIDTPVVNIQRVRTTVVVPDRGTIMLGGMTMVFDQNSESSVPLWRNIPILGNLGSTKVKGLQRMQTLVLASVRIIIPDEEARRRF
jgi:tetratricopeptide (TPR) repeat protein